VTPADRVVHGHLKALACLILGDLPQRVGEEIRLFGSATFIQRSRSQRVVESPPTRRMDSRLDAPPMNH
jgi:hypothetical protein